MSRYICDICKLDMDNSILEEKCCGVFICRDCVSATRYCPRSGCPKYLENTIQDVIIRRGYFDEALIIGQTQNYRDVKYGLEPMETAVLHNDIYMVQNLFKNNMFDKKKETMVLAIENYHLEIIRFLKDHDFPFDYQSRLQLQDDFPFLSDSEADQILL